MVYHLYLFAKLVSELHFITFWEEKLECITEKKINVSMNLLVYKIKTKLFYLQLKRAKCSF